LSWSRLLTAEACKLQSGRLALATTTRPVTRLEDKVKVIVNNVPVRATAEHSATLSRAHPNMSK
jgi:hypothetical protein